MVVLHVTVEQEVVSTAAGPPVMARIYLRVVRLLEEHCMVKLLGG